MKRLLILLMLVSQPAWAEWVELGPANVGSDGAFTVYMDPATLRKTPNGRRAWSLFSYDQPQPDLAGGTYLSSKELSEFDCTGERKRSLQFTWHSGRMGAGRVVTSGDSPSNWSVVSPESVNEAMLKAICRVPLK